ncbi:MAG: late competence development ComFB family protein [Treponema sp.]|nr:late competence development ComFB family protein [Treponema sp.]
MAFLDQYDFELLINEAEKLIINELGRQLEIYQEPLCVCNDCVLDMAAMALNTVRPIYRVSLLGTLYASTAMDQESYASTVRDAVYNAIERVRKNPSHDVQEEEEGSEE